nr:class A beta-lactamase [Alkalicoccobacillus porphyridii]
MKRYIMATIVGLVALAGCSTEDLSPSVAADEPSLEEQLSKLEEEYDARLGIYAFEAGGETAVAYQEDERFAYASTHKALAVGVLLQQKTMEELEKRITYTEEDLVTYSPITEQHIDTGLTLKEISDASIRYSDNSAANFIFDEIGGPEGFAQSLREIGDDVTQPERIETELNDVKPGETRDTSTAKALAESLYTFSVGDGLEEEKRELLNDWLIRNTTGDHLIRAGVPEEWKVGDKTGSAAYGTRNDIGVIWPPDSEPIIIAVLSSRDQEEADTDDELIAKATEEVIKRFMEKGN